jgi:Tfp pilus assembly protein PilX
MMLGTHLFAKKHYNLGVAACNAQHLADEAVANQRQAMENERKNKLASQIANAADKQGEDVIRDTATDLNKTKETTADVYAKPPTTRPVAVGSCVHPVDKRVQARIDAAVDSANDP